MIIRLLPTCIYLFMEAQNEQRRNFLKSNNLDVNNLIRDSIAFIQNRTGIGAYPPSIFLPLFIEVSANDWLKYKHNRSFL